MIEHVLGTGTEEKRSISFSSDEEYTGELSEGKNIYKNKSGKCIFVHPARPGDTIHVSMKDPGDNELDLFESSFLIDSSASEEEHYN